jgi:hypothetical protein
MKLTQKKKALMFDKICELVLSGELEILDKQNDHDDQDEDGDCTSINRQYLLDCFIELQLMKLGYRR